MIERINILNYKSIKNADVWLGNLNILIGSNGVGKSNFISFFELLNAILNKRLGSYVLERGGFERFLYQGQKISESIESLVDFDNTNAFFFTLKPQSETRHSLKHQEIISTIIARKTRNIKSYGTELYGITQWKNQESLTIQSGERRICENFSKVSPFIISTIQVFRLQCEGSAISVTMII